MHEILGDEITGRYFNGTSYTDIVYRYNNSDTVGTDLQQETPSDIVRSGASYIVYNASVTNANQNPDYITFDITPEFTLADTQYIYSFIGHSIYSGISAEVYSPPKWDWFINGRLTSFQNLALNAAQTQYAHVLGSSRQFYFTYAECSYSSNTLVSGYSQRACFYGNNVYAGVAHLVIGCPYISSSGSGASGTLPPDSGQTPTYTVVVNVDNAGVESGLNNVVSAVDGLNSALQDDGDYDYGAPDEVIEDAPDGVDEEAIEDAMSKADTILDDIPSLIATGAFWTNLAKDLVNDPAYIIIVPVCIFLSFIVYLWWKK